MNFVLMLLKDVFFFLIGFNLYSLKRRDNFGNMELDSWITSAVLVNDHDITKVLAIYSFECDFFFQIQKWKSSDWWLELF